MRTETRQSPVPAEHDIRCALNARGLFGKNADRLTTAFSASFRQIEARGGINQVAADIKARIEAAKARIGQ